MKIKISPEPPRRSAHSRTDDGFRSERRLVDQIGRQARGRPRAAVRLRRARQRATPVWPLSGRRAPTPLLREQRAPATPPPRRWRSGRSRSPFSDTT